MGKISFEKLEKLNVDVNDTLERFLQNKALYFKFLKKFLLDENYQHLVEAMQNKNLEDAICYSHTLKGLTGNLGFQDMYYLLVKILDNLRNKKVEKAEEFMPGLVQNYAAICSAIREMDE